MSERNILPIQNSEIQAQQISPTIPQYLNSVAGAARISGLLGFLAIILAIDFLCFLSSDMAVAALTFVILSFPLSILAIILGVIGMSKARKIENTLIINNDWNAAKNTGKGLAITGLILGIITVEMIPVICAIIIPIFCEVL